MSAELSCGCSEWAVTFWRALLAWVTDSLLQYCTVSASFHPFDHLSQFNTHYNLQTMKSILNQISLLTIRRRTIGRARKIEDIRTKSCYSRISSISPTIPSCLLIEGQHQISSMMISSSSLAYTTRGLTSTTSSSIEKDSSHTISSVFFDIINPSTGLWHLKGALWRRLNWLDRFFSDEWFGTNVCLPDGEQTLVDDQNLVYFLIKNIIKLQIKPYRILLNHLRL